jgi:hypothetical protein
VEGRIVGQRQGSFTHQIVRHRSRLFLIAWRHVGGPFATRRMRHRLAGVLLSGVDLLGRAGRQGREGGREKKG